MNCLYVAFLLDIYNSIDRLLHLIQIRKLFYQKFVDMVLYIKHVRCDDYFLITFISSLLLLTIHSLIKKI